MSASQRRKVLTQEHKQNISRGSKGKRPSDLCFERSRAARSGPCPEHLLPTYRQSIKKAQARYLELARAGLIQREGDYAKGSRHHWAKLDEEKVRRIRTALAEGADRDALAEQFHVTSQTIKDVERRKTWRHI